MGVDEQSSPLPVPALESVWSSEGKVMLLGVLRGGRVGLMEGMLVAEK